MDWLSEIDAQKFLLFTLVFTRVGGLVVTAPIFSTPEVPARVRALLAVALAVLVTPTQWNVAVADPEVAKGTAPTIGRSTTWSSWAAS